MKVKSLRQARNLTGKKVLLRADFNVPLDKGVVKDDYKILATLPTIRFLLRHKCKIIIATHLGAPQRNEKEPSTKLLAGYLGKVLDKKINHAHSCLGSDVRGSIGKMRAGDILVLENLRFFKEEEKNDRKFAEALSELVDIYVNDAFAVSHRKHASVSAIKRYLPSFAGLLLEEEINNLSKILKPDKPLISIVGGSKMKTKIILLKKLAKISHKVLVGGALANNFIAAHQFEIGKSLADQESIKLAKKFFKYKNIILPVDVVVGDKTSSEEARVKSINAITKKDIILDIGPVTVRLYNNFIKRANTIIWNGPLGYFENSHFSHGTLAVARIVASRSTGKAFGVVGGGETVQALKITKMIDYVDWVSTGGGAMLAFLSGEKMPGLKGIVK